MGKIQTPALQCQDCDYVAESAADLIDHRWCRMQEKVLRKATAPGTALQIAALSRAPLTQDEVEAVYGKTGLDNTRRRLCQSHERLRAELEGAEQRNAELERDNDRLQSDNRAHRDVADKNYWIWQGDEEDHPESLACPVLIQPNQLRAILAKLAEVEKELGQYQAYAETTRQRDEDRRGATLAEADAQTPDCPHCGPACDLIASPGSSRRPKA